MANKYVIVSSLSDSPKTATGVQLAPTDNVGPSCGHFRSGILLGKDVFGVVNGASPSHLFLR